ncbi:MAG: GNAT family N-acetyltransferase [Gemmatimonadales bacterium]
MPPREPAVRGPERALPADVERLNRLFSDAFSDRYQRDGMTGVRVPLLNPAIWRFAIATAGDGALVWRDQSGALVAFNMVHRSGSEGWMGPLAVRPDRQGEGLGIAIVRAGIERLEQVGVRTIGLETMPRTVENIGFYSRLGFRPGHLTVSLTRELGRPSPGPGERLSAAGSRLEDRLAQCADLTSRLVPGADYTRELELTVVQGLGDATLLADAKEVTAYALWHSAPLAEGRGPDEVRVLKLVADDLPTFRRLLGAVEAHAAEERARRLGIRCQTAFRDAYAALVDAGYRVHWTDLRMTLDGRGELPPRNGAILFSNWEI